jgi:hypothetical protein
MKYLAQNIVSMKKKVKFFYSVFPIEIEKMEYSAQELDTSGNAEARTIVTDIDAMLVAFQDKKYEFYLIEGKKHRKGFHAKCKSDLLKLKALSDRAKIFSDPVMVEEANFKGGFIKIVS